MSFWSGLAKIGGAVGGFALGGPAGAAAGYSLGSALGGSGGGGGSKGPSGLDRATSQFGSYTTPDRNRYLDTLSGGQDALNTSTKAAISAGMPQLNQELQSQRESNVRRGVSTGDLGTSFEGDITSAFQKHIADSTAAQALGLFNTQAQGYGNLYNSDTGNYLDLLQGGADRAQAKSNQKTSFWNSLIGAGAQLGGAYLGNR